MLQTIKCQSIWMVLPTGMILLIISHMISYWQTQLFLARQNSVDFVSLFPRFDDLSKIAVGTVVNNIDSVLGDIRDMSVSENGQHLFLSISRRRYEVFTLIRNVVNENS